MQLSLLILKGGKEASLAVLEGGRDNSPPVVAAAILAVVAAAILAVIVVLGTQCCWTVAMAAERGDSAGRNGLGG
jgi:hypothetical protein